MKKELETPIQAVMIYSDDIGMEFGFEKFVMQIMKSRKQRITKRIKQPNLEKNQNTRRKETHKYFRIIEANTIK